MQEELNAYLASLSLERRLSAHTVRAYRNDLTAFFDWCQRYGLSPGQIDQRDMRGYLAELDQARYSRRTINRRLSAVKTFYNWLIVNGKLDVDPINLISGSKQSGRLPVVVRSADLDLLLRSITGSTPVNLRDRAFLELLYASGARISEIAAIDLDDLDFSRLQMRLMGKGSKERMVPLHRLALQKISEYLADGYQELAASSGLADHDLMRRALFLSSRGAPMSADSLRKVFTYRRNVAGLDSAITPHTIRHTFATDLIINGADLRSVQELLGHSSLETTQIYSHLSIGHLKETHGRAHPRA
jgi:integrase/recombinase XerD